MPIYYHMKEKKMSYITKITELFKDEFKANIMFILDMFGSQNLQTLHELLKKPKSTILGHLKEMVLLKQIELDSEMTANKTGKYYKLTPEIHETFDQEDGAISLKKNTLDELGLDKGDFVQSLANLMRTVGFQGNLMANLTAQYLEDNVHLFSDLEKNKQDLIGFFASLYELSLDSFEEYEEVYKIQKEFDGKLKKFYKGVDPNRKNSKHTLLMFVLGCPKDKIAPK